MPSQKKTVRRTALIALVVVVLLGIVLARVIRSDENPQQQAAAAPADARVAVTVHVVQQEQLSDEIFATGTVRANEEVDLQSEIAGKVVEINFREGSNVRQGDVLLRINDSELRAQLQQAKFRLDLAQEREARQQTLLERGGVSQEAYDVVLNEYNIRQAELQLIEAQLEKMEIRAPFDGVIGLRYVSEGAFINQNSRIALLQSVDPVKVDFAIPERYAGRVRVGDRIVFTVQGVDGSFTGEIYAIEPRIDPETRTLQLRAITRNPNRQLLPGGFAEITLLLDQVDDALLVPAISMVASADQRSVFVVENGRAQTRRIQTGVRTSTSVQVTDGLAPGDSVITSGIQQLRPGTAIRVLNIESGGI